MSASPAEPELGAAGQPRPGIDDMGLKTKVAEVLGRWPSAGLAAGVVRGGTLEWFLGHGAPVPLATALIRRALGLPDQPIRTGIPPRPDVWGELCGWYGPDPGPVTNLFLRPLWGAGVEVTVCGGHLVLKPLTPVPAMRRGLRLYPDDPHDPRVFRAEMPEFGMSLLVAFSATPTGGTGTTRLVLEDWSFHKRPDYRNPRRSR